VTHNYYSVPYQLVHAQEETRATASVDTQKAGH
jgi:hypothetical protein